MAVQFQVGAQCLGQNYVRRPERNGMQCEVIDGLRKRMTRDPDTGNTSESLTYVVLWSDGTRTAATPEKLRRKPVSRVIRDIDTVVDWSECAWQPMHVRLALAIALARQGGA